MERIKFTDEQRAYKDKISKASVGVSREDAIHVLEWFVRLAKKPIFLDKDYVNH